MTKGTEVTVIILIAAPSGIALLVVAGAYIDIIEHFNDGFNLRFVFYGGAFQYGFGYEFHKYLPSFFIIVINGQTEKEIWR